MTTDEYRKQCEWLADFYAKAASTGRKMQFNKWGEDGWTTTDSGPDTGSNPKHWRLKPEPQKAWVVWANNWACVLMTEQAAKNQARMSGGTIQEITLPEPK